MLFLLIGLIPLLLVGNAFYGLAVAHQKNGWLYGVIGSVTYLFSAFVFGVLMVLTSDIFAIQSSALVNLPLIRLLQIPFGLVCCYVLYRILRKQWKDKKRRGAEDVLDSDLMK